MKTTSSSWSQLQVSRTDDFTGGINLRANAFELGQSESPDLLNVDIDPRGGFSMRGGTSLLNSSAIGAISNGSFTPQTVFEWRTATPQLLVSANSAVYYTASSTFSTMTGVATTAPLGATFAPWTTSTTSLVYLSTGSTGYKWNGSAATALTVSATGQWQETLASPVGTHMPTSRFAASHVDRMWVAYTTEDGNAYPNRLRFSHPLFPESWRSADFIDIVDGGSGITGMSSFGGSLVVFKEHGIFLVMGYSTDTFQVVPISKAHGCVNSLAFAEYENYLFFFDWPMGLYMYDGRQIQNVFSQIMPGIQSGAINAAATQAIRVSAVNRRIWVSVPESSGSNIGITYVFDPTLGSWTRFELADGYGYGKGTNFTDGSGNQRYVFAHPANPYVLSCEKPTTYTDTTGTGSAANFSSYYVTKWQDAGYVSVKKRWRRLDLVCRQFGVDNSMDLLVSYDWMENYTQRAQTLYQTSVSTGGNPLVWGTGLWGTNTWGGSITGSQYLRSTPLGPARAVQVKFAGKGGIPWGINSITYKYNFRRLRA